MAWFAVFGYMANHFAVSVNHLKQYSTLAAVIACLQGAGYAMNDSGGLIKGSPAVYLEQASTLAEWRPIDFPEGV